MKEQILKIAKDLEQGTITQTEAQDLLLGLFGVSYSLPIDLNKVLRFDQPYSLPNILDGLIECADVLLHEKGYDRSGWERLEYCYRHAKDITKLFEGNDS